MQPIKDVLMQRDGITPEEADQAIENARDDLYDRLASGEMPYDLCEEWFGLEPDYLEELI